MVRLSWALSSALGAGMDVADSLRLGIQASQSRKFLEIEPRISEDIVDNQTIFETLSKTKAFPDEFLTLVSNGEISGSLPETLDRASDMYQERVKNGLTLLKTATFVASLMIVGMILVTAIIFLFNKVYLGTLREFME
jgi:type IV pilus assembly protein PilC